MRAQRGYLFLVALAVVLSAPPVLAATFTVTNTNDSGPGSLRDAITQVNATVGFDTIVFALTGTPPFLISVTTPLPVLTDSVFINGASQPGFVDNAIIRIDGPGSSSGNGLEFNLSGVVNLQALQITRFAGHGVLLTQAGGVFLGDIVLGGGPGLGNGGDGLRSVNVSEVYVGLGLNTQCIITNNGGRGINILGSNTIAGIIENSIHSNTGFELDLGGDGRTLNDPLDADSGPSGLQNFPVLTSVIVGASGVTLQGTLHSTPNEDFFIDVYSNSPSVFNASDPSAQTHQGFLLVTTDAAGNASFSVDLPSIPVGHSLTATATNETFFKTSEISNGITVGSSAPALGITKVGPGTPVTAGSTFSYNIQIQNTGSSPASGVLVQDFLPADLTFVSISTPPGFGCSTPPVGSNGTITCTAGSMAGGSTAAFVLTVRLADQPAGSSITNTATANYSGSSGPVSGTSVTSIQAPAPDPFTLALNDNPDPVTAGDLLDLNLTLTGVTEDSNVVVNLNLPPELTIAEILADSDFVCTTGPVVCTTTALSPSEIENITFRTRVRSSTPAGTNLTAEVHVTSTSEEQGLTTSTTTAVVANADLSIEIVDDPNPVSPGGVLAYLVTASNGGQSDALTVTFRVTLPTTTAAIDMQVPAGWTCVRSGSFVDCSASSLAAGASALVIIRERVAADQPHGSILNVEARISSSTPDQNSVNNSDLAFTDVLANRPSLDVIKGNETSRVVAGGPIGYTITIHNRGPGNAPTVSMSDSFPGIQGSSLRSTCTPSGGATCTADGFPNGIVSIPAGGTVTFSITGTTFPSQTGVITNTVNVNDGFASYSDSESDEVDQTADIHIEKTDFRETGTAGAAVRYQIFVLNRGPSESRVDITDVLGFSPINNPQWSCGQCEVPSGTGDVQTSAVLSPGESVIVVVTGTVASNFSGQMTNTATARGNNDPGGTKSATDQTEITGATGKAWDLQTHLSPFTINPATGEASGKITFTNLSEDPIQDPSAIRITEVILGPAPLGIEAFLIEIQNETNSRTDVQKVKPGDRIQITIPGLDSGQSSSVGVRIHVDPRVPRGTQYQFTVLGEHRDDDPNTRNNSDSELITTVRPTKPNLFVDLTAPAFIYSGDEFEYELEIGNLGGEAATDTELTLALPAGVDLAAELPEGCTGTEEILCVIPELGVDQVRRLSIRVDSDDVTTRTITGGATIAWNEGEGTDEAVTEVYRPIRTFVAPHVFDTKGNSSFSFDFFFSATNNSGLQGVSGGDADVSVFLFDENGGELRGETSVICPTGCKFTLAPGQKLRESIEDLANENAGGLRGSDNPNDQEVTLGYSIITVTGPGAEATNLFSFITNSHEGAFQLSVLGFTPEEIRAANKITARSRTVTFPWIAETEGRAGPSISASDTTFFMVYGGGLENIPGGLGANADLYLFNNDGTAMRGRSGEVCAPCPMTLTEGARTHTFDVEELVQRAGGFDEVKEGFAQILIQGADADKVAILGLHRRSAGDGSPVATVPLSPEHREAPCSNQ